MIHIRINLANGEWKPYKEDNVHVSLRGTIYLDQLPANAEQLLPYFSKAIAMEDLQSICRRFNGFYAIVEQSASRIRAVVDHVRSIPLFYAHADGTFYLSDDAEWVRKQVGDSEMDPTSCEEFQLTGYVTGADTLFPQVKQLQAGEFLVATSKDGMLEVRTHRYYRFTHIEPTGFDEPKMRSELDRVASASVQRLIDYASGRQIVVPLSGGYDSRLIVTLLKRFGYENVLTFTYGVSGNEDSVYSKRVADTLGFRWLFVEYSEKMWRDAWATEACWKYQKWASGWSSLAHVQDWLAVKVMHEQGALESDCIMAPGHTGDFVTGGHIPKQARTNVPATPADMTESVIEKHYRLAPLEVVSKRGHAFWSKRILDRTEQPIVTNGQSFANVFEEWEWQERQAKFICNSVRVYDVFGYDWWMPLWDIEFVRFWESVPLKQRKARVLYLEYVNAQFADNSLDKNNVVLGNAIKSSPPIIKILKGILGTPVGVLYRSGWLLYKYRKYENSPVSPKHRFGRWTAIKYLSKGYDTNGIDCHMFLRRAKIEFSENT